MLDPFNVCKIHHMGNCIFCGGEPIQVALTHSELAIVEKYKELWRQLHTEVSVSNLDAWEKNLPSKDCECKSFYKQWKAQNPPKADDLFDWTVELHNAVNAKLGKPKITLDEARRIWMV